MADELRTSVKQARLSAIVLREGHPYASAGMILRDPECVPREQWGAMLRCARGESPWPLTLIGGVGAGKTCAALCLLDLVCGGRKYVPMPDLCEEIIEVQQGRREYGSRPDTTSKWWDRWSKMAVVVVDEIGARDRVSEFQYETIKRALDSREGLPAVYVSNMTPSALARIYDDRVVSRLVSGTVVRFPDRDLRVSA